MIEKSFADTELKPLFKKKCNVSQLLSKKIFSKIL